MNQEELYADYLRRCRDIDSDIYAHLPLLYWHAASKHGSNILELGVRWGNSTSALLLAAHDSGGMLYSVDVNKPDVPFEGDERWRFLQCDDMHMAAVIFAEGGAPYDVLFIDTSHELEHTLHELRTYGEMVKAGGVILCHDTEWQGCEVATALDIYAHDMGRLRQTRKPAKDWWVNIPGCNGMGVLNL
jgi:predicted O-methyltransferase YrrM